MQYSYTPYIYYIQHIEICIFKTIWGYDIEVLYLLFRHTHIHGELGILEIFGIYYIEILCVLFGYTLCPTL
jgi:hypothetical protein